MGEFSLPPARVALLGKAGPLADRTAEALLSLGLEVAHAAASAGSRTGTPHRTFPFGREARDLLREPAGLTGLVLLLHDPEEVPLALATLDRLAPELHRPGFVVIVAPSLPREGQPLADLRREARAVLRERVRALGKGLAPGIRVNMIVPGSTTSPDELPLAPVAPEESVAAGVALLASPGAGFITGIELVIDGGASLLWPLARGESDEPSGSGDPAQA